jgi:diguanylate cyclase (GGDEF)-like protein/PAS domain S-box-containing protein
MIQKSLAHLAALNDQFMKRYENEAFFVAKQAFYLYLTCSIALVMVILVACFNVLIYPMEEGFHFRSPLLYHLLVDLLLLVLFIVGRELAKKGSYYFAANLLGVGTVVAVSIGAVLNIEGFLYTGINSFLYLFFTIALFIAFFNERAIRIYLAISLVFINGMLYGVVLWQSKTIMIREVFHALLNSTAALIVILSVGYFLIQMMHQVISEKETIIKHNNELKEALENKVMLRTQELVEYNRQLEGEIRKRNLMERALKESEGKYRTIFESSGTAICIINASGLVALCNSEFCRLTGYRKSELEEKISWTKFVHHDDFKRIYHFITSIQLQSQYETHTDFRMIDRYGKLFELSMNIEKISEDNQLIVSLLDITEKNMALKRLQILASVDPLTELFNRRYFLEHANSYLEQAKADSECGGLLYLDIDNFKRINDTHGHGVGDDLLHDVAIRLKRFVEPSGIAARIGGDEFVMLMIVKDKELLIKRLIKFIQDMEVPFVYDKLQLTLSFSIGVSLYPDQGRDYDKLIAMADEAMYQAKDEGKNRFVLYEAK